MERASLKESSATKNVKNKAWRAMMRDAAGRCRRGGAIERALAGGRLLLMRHRLGYWSRDVVDKMHALAARWPCAGRALVAAACALAAHVIFVWRSPAGRRSGEAPAMS
ncbi:hypothetical protein F511_45787 [Dorcoceras hygrometricum]|uniref:Uncharacterized protein n=1 Tax=Dorcoceras hygrometricum TaxID=472368 RepID=A0A2Z7A2K3_9LAMI|nr:hypothetical protein F511_45787 [Dorcoceras hygrometricum]